MISLVLFTFITCEYEDYPDPIWDEDAAGNPTPTIESVDPPNLAYEGITVITIKGENYSSVMAHNQITFNGVIGEINSETSTAAALKVTVPVVIKDDELNALDSVKIMVAVQGAYAGAIYDQNFRVERAVVDLGGFGGEKPAKNPIAIACDGDENIYVATASDKKIYKIDTLGVRTEYGSGLSSVTEDMKIGPGGYLYFVRGRPGSLYRVDPGGGTAVRWHNVGTKLYCFDFDADQNAYVAGANDSLYFVDIANDTDRGAAPAIDYSYVALRIYDGYVYVAGTYTGLDTNITVTQGIWRHEILAGEDTLGTRELVYDWTEMNAVTGQDILDLIVSSDGIFYLGLSEGSGAAIMTLDPATQDLQEFYDAVLTAPATNLAWGNSNYIYCAQYSAAATEDDPNVALQIAQSDFSAPYYGRD